MNKWITSAPIWSFYQDQNNIFSNELIIGEEVKIFPTPDWMKSETFSKSLSFSEKEQIKEASFCFGIAYDADSLGHPDKNWEGKQLRSIQQTSAEKIMLANLALWISKPTCIGFRLIFHNENSHEVWHWREYSSQNRLLPNEKDCDTSMNSNDIDVARNLFAKILSLKREGSIWVAIHSLWSALIADIVFWEVRYLLLWIALEALYGADTEISHKVSERIAFFLKDLRKSAKENYIDAKKAYDWRSKIIHGMKIKRDKKGESAEVMVNTEDIVRLSLLKILQSEELIRVFNSRSREDYLYELIFNH